MQRVSSSLTTRPCDQSVYEHDPARHPARDPASDPASDLASDSVSDSANLQMRISVILKSYRTHRHGGPDCHARASAKYSSTLEVSMQGAVSSAVLLLILWWVEFLRHRG